ncbi:MAG: endopeptidase La [Bacteroidetes bacterium]|nr:MAG: endopeptidase La [Bacteroidota bacterium]
MKDLSQLPFPLDFLSDTDDEASDSLPIISINDDDTLDDDLNLDSLVVLPVKNTVLFPKVVIPITVSRKKSIRLIKKAYKGDKIVGVLAQTNPDIADPTTADMRLIGTVARIVRMLVLPDGNTTIILQGVKRFKVTEFLTDEPSISAKVELLLENFPPKKDKQVKAMVDSLKDAAFKIMQLNPEIPQEAQVAIKNIESPNFLTNFLSANVNATVHEKQSLLETEDGLARAEKLLEFMHRDIQLLEIKREIHHKVHTDIDQQQRDYYLRQQIKVIQDELGHENNEREVEALRLKAKNKQWNEATAKHFQKELEKLARTNVASPEYGILFNYVELMVELPWGEFTEDSHDLKKAAEILEKEHFGLEKIKERILEYLAVLKLKNDMKAPILCLYGPPGVGKTSLGKSIAKALNRKYARIALGGLHDEGEIRGHRKTYIGAMPGRIIQNLRKTQTSNPVFILDEIDKVGSDHRGDPASALLEVLDPEQNHSFADNYLDLEYDLSNILFIATANNLDTIHPALRDRMEIIDVSGYTVEEKLQIAKRHLLPEQRKENGLQAKDFKIDDKALLKIIQGYTRESGVRNLKRQIGGVCRKIAKSIAMEEKYIKNIRENDVPTLLGTEVFDREQYEQPNQAGVVTGLAWTSVGGEILFIECSLSRGKGKLTLSGQLGDVMKESATAALSYLKTVADDWSIDFSQFDTHDLHLHVPAGAVPKDGPSAGVAMFTALLSVFTGKLVKKGLAMTGEITLTGRVLPVGGIKEKILAAKRAGITDIILCERNRKDVEEIPQDYLKELTFHYVRHASEVASIAIES